MDYNDSKVNDGEIIMEIKYYSIKEAAELLSMTKPGIRYRLKLLSIPLEKDAFGRVVLSESALQWVRDGKKPESVGESEEKQREEAESVSETSEQNGQETERDPESGENLEKDSESIPERKRKFRKEKRKKAERIEKNNKETESKDSAALVEALREELKAKDAQIAEKDQQLAGMQRTIDSLTANLANVSEALSAAQRTAEGAQALQAATVKMLQDAKAAEDEPDTSGDSAHHKKRSLLDRILGRV